jgi:tRNA-modifying protein YgfZ
MTTSEASVCLLQPLGVLGIRGPDARRFLQGQLSNDVGALGADPGRPARPAHSPHAAHTPQADPGDTSGPLLWAGLHSPQGRTLALLGLIAPDADSVLALLPRELIGATRATLQRYVLRSKVTLSDDSDAWRIYGLTDGAVAGDGIRVRYQGTRQLLLANPADAAPRGAPLSYEGWHAADVAAGLPQVYAATAGQFVAQMLNLDCIGAISFSKGCYTGQEVIARAHYRGRVKRRMQRFISRDPAQLSAGERGELRAGGGFHVVDSVQHADGRCEFLAVTTLPGRPADANADANADVNADAGVDGSAAAGAAVAVPRRIDAINLPLPYALPD